MGRSNTLAEQAKTNKEFQDYIDQQEKYLRDKQAEAKKELDSMRAEYFKKGAWNDEFPYIEGEKYLQSTLSEWSLDRVASLVSNLADALFGKPVSIPGVVINEAKANVAVKTAEQTAPKGAHQKQEEYGAMIKDVVMSAINGALSSFRSTTSTEVSKSAQAKVLMPGMTMFLSIIQNQYDSRQFLKSDQIIQVGFMFEVYISLKQAQSQESFDLLQAIIDLQETNMDTVEKIAGQLRGLSVTLPDYLDQRKKWKLMLADVNDDIKDTQARIVAITQARVAYADQLVSNHLA